MALENFPDSHRKQMQYLIIDLSTYVHHNSLPDSAQSRAKLTFLNPPPNHITQAQTLEVHSYSLLLKHPIVAKMCVPVCNNRYVLVRLWLGDYDSVLNLLRFSLLITLRCLYLSVLLNYKIFSHPGCFSANLENSQFKEPILTILYPHPAKDSSGYVMKMIPL